MAIRKVARLGHPILRTQGRLLTKEEIKSPEIKQLIQDMIETMDEYGGIGIAAPQVHEGLKLALIQFDEDSARYPDMGRQDLEVFINPVITVLETTEQAFWEGCLSVPGMRGKVSRPRKVKVDYLDANAKQKTIEAEGFLATVIQHELDHLDGILYVDRLKTTRELVFQEEYDRYHAPTEKDDDSVEGDEDFVGELPD